jgi:hypothetical protein
MAENAPVATTLRETTPIEFTIPGPRHTTEGMTSDVRPEEVAQTETSPDIFAEMRLVRQLNTYSKPSDEALHLDDEIIALVELGDPEAAAQLVTASTSENRRLNDAILRRHPGIHLTEDPTQLVVEKICRQKAQTFEAAFTEHFAALPPEQRQEISGIVRAAAADPATALEVPASFWAHFHELSDEARAAFLSAPASLAVAAESLSVMGSHGVMSCAGRLMPYAVKIEDPTKRSAYIESFARAFAIAGRTAQAAALLSEFEDPQRAATLAVEIYQKDPSESLGDLARALGVFEPERPVAIPTETAQILGQSVKAVRNIRVSSPEEPYAVQSIMKLREAADTSLLRDLLATLSTEEMRWRTLRMPGADEDSSATRIYQGVDVELRLALRASPPEEAERRIRVFIQKTQLAEKARAFYTADLRRNGEGLRRATPDEDVPDEALDSLGFNELFESLQIPKEIGDEMRLAWSSFSVMEEAMHRTGKTNEKDLTQGELLGAADEKVKMIYEQATAAARYVELYGGEELVKLHETFGIVNFVRGSPEDFHDQLMRWNEAYPDPPPKPEEDPTSPLESDEDPTPPPEDAEDVINFCVAAYDDPSTAFRKEARLFFKNFGTKGGYYFEAGKRAQVGRIFVAIGNRARHLNRDPETDPTVENMVAAGHGTSTNVILSHGESIDIESYAEAIRGRIRLSDAQRKAEAQPAKFKPRARGNRIKTNTYARHVGNKLRVIFDACGVAGDARTTYNITEMITRAHGMTAEGAPTNITGFRLDDEDNVIYSVKENGIIVDRPSVRYEP